ncbi:somatostatin receptor type 4-like [Amphiura filiformis]|uniref:somatostatin receptor type 4-like n=1 Tax=Amphiura filiformis TaxID=82378 RepID=UPI003B21F179
MEVELNETVNETDQLLWSEGIEPGNEGDDTSGGWGIGGIENSTAIRTVYGIIAFIGILGNAVVCFALIRVANLRKRTSSFIIHLAITDLVTSIWVIPFHLFPNNPIIPNGIAGELMCRLYVSKYPFWATVFASVYSLVTINIERYIAIVYPTKFKIWFTPTRGVIMMLFCWVIGLVSNTFFFYLYDHIDGSPICAFIFWPSPGVQRFVGVYIFCLIYIIPTGIMLVAQLKMVNALRHQAKSLSQKNAQNATNETKRETWQLKAAQELEKMLLFVIITYILCWGPNQVVFFMFNMGAPINFQAMYYHISVVLAVMNSAINPFIYVFKNANFRKGVIQSFGITKFGNKVDSVSGLPSGSNTASTAATGTGIKASTVMSTHRSPAPNNNVGPRAVGAATTMNGPPAVDSNA